MLSQTRKTIHNILRNKKSTGVSSNLENSALKAVLNVFDSKKKLTLNQNKEPKITLHVSELLLYSYLDCDTMIIAIKRLERMNFLKCDYSQCGQELSLTLNLKNFSEKR